MVGGEKGSEVYVTYLVPCSIEDANKAMAPKSQLNLWGV